MRYLALILCIFPLPVFADLALSQLVGRWDGNGVYQDNSSTFRLRCKLRIEGEAARIDMSGRCVSGLGTQTISLVLLRFDDGSFVVSGGHGPGSNNSEIKELRGRPTPHGVLLSAKTITEHAKMEFLLEPDGALRWGAIREAPRGGYRSVVTLRRK